MILLIFSNTHYFRWIDTPCNKQYTVFSGSISVYYVKTNRLSVYQYLYNSGRAFAALFFTLAVLRRRRPWSWVLEEYLRVLYGVLYWNMREFHGNRTLTWDVAFVVGPDFLKNPYVAQNQLGCTIQGTFFKPTFLRRCPIDLCPVNHFVALVNRTDGPFNGEKLKAWLTCQIDLSTHLVVSRQRDMMLYDILRAWFSFGLFISVLRLFMKRDRNWVLVVPFVNTASTTAKPNGLTL